MLEVRDIHCAYDKALILQGVSLSVSPGEILCLMGRNGAGKTTTLKTIMGLVVPSSGSVMFDGVAISQKPAHEIPRLGLGYIPQGRRLFSELTVAENLEIGLMVRGGGDKVRQRVLDIFPRLRERLDQHAHTLSGGEQQMLATARALCLEPSVLLLDEPTEGLQPSMIEQIRQVIIAMKNEGVAIILVEQRLDAVLALGDRVTFIENGQSRETLNVSELSHDNEFLMRYVGV
ncbi:MAG: ABC transporter ATP-binding protein [Rhizobiaceae bacterium]|nr:ABC transporter ATP-binding protein [Rhizobiaceae bacterium]